MITSVIVSNRAIVSYRVIVSNRVILSGAKPRSARPTQSKDARAKDERREQTCVILSGAYGTRMRALAQSKDPHAT